ncbi:hypothetical protein, conserved [Eimeria tenella]|uniref:Transmembrane protein n=1 Tax=Eimeria tenella TaxID=5802 RepID=U6KNW0_EIMTE|nr:hypothetical protein, conserved [Eimeria tenella]CDJ38506.1 hypothetical protein, conserved [Eimeria tenella]|eukprot:XP_013229344.1 hypothetical protein, conserved [Eimeria tenella]
MGHSTEAAAPYKSERGASGLYDKEHGLGTVWRGVPSSAPTTHTGWLSADEETLQYTTPSDDTNILHGSPPRVPSIVYRGRLSTPYWRVPNAWPVGSPESVTVTNETALHSGQKAGPGASTEPVKGSGKRLKGLLLLGIISLWAFLAASLARNRLLQREDRSRLKGMELVEAAAGAEDAAPASPTAAPLEAEEASSLGLKTPKEHSKPSKAKPKLKLALQPGVEPAPSGPLRKFKGLQGGPRTASGVPVAHVGPMPHVSNLVTEPPSTVRPEEFPLDIACDASSLDHYEREVGKNLDKLDKIWRGVSETTRMAFSRHFLPVVEPGVVLPAPVALFQRHAEALSAIRRPKDADSAAEKKMYAFRLQLLDTLYTAAGRRLLALSALEAFCKMTGVGSELLGLEAEPLIRGTRSSWGGISSSSSKAGEGAAGDEAPISFEGFVKLLAGRPTSMIEREPESKTNEGLSASGAEAGETPVVPKHLAVRLANVLRREDLLVAQELMNVNIFRALLDRLDERLLSQQGGKREAWIVPMSPGRRPFHTDLFSDTVLSFDKWARQQVLPPEVVGSWNERWTESGVRALLHSFEQKERERIEQRQSMKHVAAGLDTTPGNVAPLYDLYTLAISLL